MSCAGTAAWFARELGLRLTLLYVLRHPRLRVAPAGGASPPGLVPSLADQSAAVTEMLEQIVCSVFSQRRWTRE